MNIYNPREIAFIALMKAKQGIYIPETLCKWQKDMPSSRDLHLAQEIAFGAARQYYALDYLVRMLMGKIPKLKIKERIILHMAIYQYFFMDRIPVYAINNEMVKIAKKYCHRSFVGFINALLRKLPNSNLCLPKGNDTYEMSIRYSYPEFFVNELVNYYGIEKAKNIMDIGNKPSVMMARIRSGIFKDSNKSSAIVKVESLESFPYKPSEYYIQNITPTILVDYLCNGLKKYPKNILDLCASPGGKTINVFDHFPKANYIANDISTRKLKRIKENFSKYVIDAELNIARGENFHFDKMFDIIILDVPCSNCGVFNKRPEARWRFSEEYLKEMCKLQINLIKNSVKGITREGEIWYMTCSILPHENELVIEQACKDFNLKINGEMQLILPNEDGKDGGFACSLSIK